MSVGLGSVIQSVAQSAYNIVDISLLLHLSPDIKRQKKKWYFIPMSIPQSAWQKDTMATSLYQLDCVCTYARPYACVKTDFRQNTKS